MRWTVVPLVEKRLSEEPEGGQDPGIQDKIEQAGGLRLGLLGHKYERCSSSSQLSGPESPFITLYRLVSHPC